MNNLYRELAPITGSAWEQIEIEARRTLKRHMAARRVVDVAGPKGIDHSAVGTGHLQNIQSPGDGIQAAQRLVKTLVELRVPFELTRQAIDDVERGAADSDWSPLKDAALKIAFAEDSSVFEGYAAAGIQGIREGNSNSGVTLPSSVKGYPDVVAQAVSQLRLAGVNGPYDEVLARGDIDAIYVATVHTTHASLVHAALDAGKPVLCEKPLTADPGDTDAVIAHAARVGVEGHVLTGPRWLRTPRAVCVGRDPGVDDARGAGEARGGQREGAGERQKSHHGRG